MANYIYIDNTGTIVPDTGAIQTQVQNEFLTAFGSNLVLDPETPQGLLITMETLARDSVAANNATLANQINPNIAGGVYLDAIWAFTGGQRDAGSKSYIVSVTMTGVAGTVIPALTSLAKTNDTAGSIFQLVNEVVLGPGGTGFGLFQALVVGPIEAPLNTFNIIVNGPIGWETVNNSTFAAVLGVAQQSDESARASRRNSLALQGSAFAEAIMSQLTKTPGVRSQSFRENFTSGTLVIDGVTLVQHSMYSCVDGGTDADVAAAISSKKDGGCNYNNGPGIPISFPYVDPSSGQTTDVLFDRPNLIQILVRATVKIISAAGDPQITVKQAILDYANGLIDGEPGFTVGTPVSCFELAGAVNVEIPGLFVTNMETSLSSPVVYSNAEIPIAIFEKAITDSSSIVVVVV